MVFGRFTQPGSVAGVSRSVRAVTFGGGTWPASTWAARLS